MKQNKNEKIRCFVAIDLPQKNINRIKNIQKTIKEKNLFTGKFTKPENLHLTLKFLGEIDEEKIKKVKKRLKKINFDNFEAQLGNVNVFSKNFIKIVWIKLNGKSLLELQKKIDDNLDDLFKPEQRFMSHITIARVKDVKNKETLIEFLKNIKNKEDKFKINKFFLKKSELFPEGPIYKNIEAFNLKALNSEIL